MRSGAWSDEYFDKYQFESNPDLLEGIAEHMAGLLPSKVELLAGLEMGGIPLATAVSAKTRLPTLFVRKAAKSYGTARIAEGPHFRGKRVCLIEDVITTGGAVMDAAAALRNGGAEVQGVVCVIYRGKETSGRLGDIPMKCLFTMDELKR